MNNRFVAFILGSAVVLSTTGVDFVADTVARNETTELNILSRAIALQHLVRGLPLPPAGSIDATKSAWKAYLDEGSDDNSPPQCDRGAPVQFSSTQTTVTLKCPDGVFATAAFVQDGPTRVGKNATAQQPRWLSADERVTTATTYQFYPCGKNSIPWYPPQSTLDRSLDNFDPSQRSKNEVENSRDSERLALYETACIGHGYIDPDPNASTRRNAQNADLDDWLGAADAYVAAAGHAKLAGDLARAGAMRAKAMTAFENAQRLVETDFDKREVDAKRNDAIGLLKMAGL